ncbi:MAG: pilus assembly protein [Brevundimonas sp.]|uniref:TadE/TadG family type IV pilus assembly protein n=1 Tax=Brevundimonas sp. TaxID=1871086 RepID=UPI00261F9D67|nr:TadE/TadG family type IV pilus assembly protein [Brevundimonas sp.]MDI6624010.1 pilus assembly protein [Brevundimonas sp.]MDQ7813465.1 pilus assembly protein [Brevundimonas sp.]
MKRRSLIRRLTGDERGVSAIEFAMLAPVLIAFYMGMTEFCQGFMAQKRMGHVSAMVADLIAQEETVAAATIDDIFDIGGLIMKPFPTATLHQRVSSVTRTGGTDTVDWSRGDGMTPRAVASTMTLPQDLVEEGESVIVAEVTYDYDSAADYLMPGLTRFSHTYYLRPRTADKTTCDDC